jgi:hypothetical protein
MPPRVFTKAINRGCLPGSFYCARSAPTPPQPPAPMCSALGCTPRAPLLSAARRSAKYCGDSDRGCLQQAPFFPCAYAPLFLTDHLAPLLSAGLPQHSMLQPSPHSDCKKGCLAQTLSPCAYAQLPMRLTTSRPAAPSGNHGTQCRFQSTDCIKGCLVQALSPQLSQR